MAEGIVHEGKTLEQMEMEITCAVCKEHYTEPKVLPCLHYYCKRCVLKLATRKASNQPFSCPECRKDTTLPEGGVEELKTAFFVNRYKSNFYALERVHSKVEVKCEGCSDSGAKAEAFCRHCVTFICKKCVESHERLKVFSSHELDSLEDLRHGRARQIAAKEPRTKKCLTHEEPLIIYCFDCNTLICRDCTVIAHKEHKFEFSKVAAPDTKKKLLKDLSSLKAAAVTLSGAVTDIQTTKQEVEAQGNSVANTINTSFNQLQLILEQHKQQLLQESKNKVQQKIDKLTVQEKNLFLAHAEVQSTVDYTERFVGHCSDNEVMSMHAEIKKRIEQEIEKHSQSGRSLEPAEEADMGVEVGGVESLQQLCQTKAKITQLPIDPAKCTLRGEGTEFATVDQATDITVTTKLSNNKTTRRRAVVAGQLKSLYNGSVVKCKMEQSGPGEYRIQYTPTVRGRHSLTVSVDGQQVAGSPFPVSVSIHPTQLGRPVKMWTGLKVPRNVAINSTGQIIVAEFMGDIVTLDKDGKKTILVEKSQSGLFHLWSIALDKEDNIYCIDSDTNRILRSDLYGGNIQVYKVKQIKRSGHSGVAVVENEVMVCERENEGTVMVYDKNLNYKRCIDHGGATFVGIFTDIHGSIYATDDNNMVRVFSKNGVFLHSFGCDSNGVKMLSGPLGVCVSGQFVYVTNYHGHNVSVFTTAGDYVTSFGRRGKGDGEFNGPSSVCTDLDNFVYIVDSFNYKVQCF